MSAKERIESLTNSWYGYTLFLGALSVLRNGFSLFWLFITGGVTAFYLIVTYFLGKRLVGRSSLTRTLLLGASLLFSVVGAVGTVKLTGGLLSSFSFAHLFELGATVIWLGMNVQSFRVLTDKSVKSYFA